MKIVFISGAQRAGTTMLEELLNTHPKFMITHELDWMHMLKNINGALFHPRHTSRRVLQYKGNYVPIFEELYRQSSIKKLEFIGDKLPGYADNYSLLLKFFPEAKHIFCLRNPLDVLNSMISRAYDSQIGLDRGWEPELDINKLCGKWKSAYESMVRFRKNNESNFLLMKYEDMTAMPDKFVLSLAEFLGAEPSFELKKVQKGKTAREFLDESAKSCILQNLGKYMRDEKYE